MEQKQGIGFFEKYLTIWVALCIIIGIAVGQWLPIIPQTLSKFEYANVSIPVAFLIWLMIYPMMLKVDFQSVLNVGKRPKGIVVTCVTNWLIKPFTMFGIAYLFFFYPIQGMDFRTVGRGVFSWGGIIGSCPLYSNGLRMELPHPRKRRLHIGAGSCQRFDPVGSVCPYRCFPAVSWRCIYPVGHVITLGWLVCRYPFRSRHPHTTGSYPP